MLGDWAGKTIAIGGMGDLDTPTTALLEISKVRSDGRVRVAYADMAHQKLEPPEEVFLPADLTISEAVLSLAYVRPDRAAVAPKVSGLGAKTTRRGARELAGLVAAIIVLAIVLEMPWLLGMALISGIISGLALLLPKTLQAGIRPRVLDGGREYFASHVYAQLTVDDTTADPALLSPRSRVDLVKERFGALQGDIVYRIENSALFDAAVPQTQRFELALMAWDELSPQATELATEVEAAFDEARRHAEAVGLDHLPETARNSGRRAARAAHAALHGGTVGERETARRRVADILSSLALYYLPPVDPSTPSLIGERKQIEPR